MSVSPAHAAVAVIIAPMAKPIILLPVISFPIRSEYQFVEEIVDAYRSLNDLLHERFAEFDVRRKTTRSRPTERR
jgi:hypothetical protein